MNDDLMIFAPLVPFVLLALWGIWKQRKNPRLFRALCGSVVITAVGLWLGIAVSLLVAIVAVVIMALIWSLTLVVRSSR